MWYLKLHEMDTMSGTCAQCRYWQWRNIPAESAVVEWLKDPSVAELPRMLSYLTLCDMCSGVSISSKMAPFTLDPLRLASCRSQPDRSQFCTRKQLYTDHWDTKKKKKNEKNPCCDVKRDSASHNQIKLFFLGSYAVLPTQRWNKKQCLHNQSPNLICLLIIPLR